MATVRQAGVEAKASDNVAVHDGTAGERGMRRYALALVAALLLPVLAVFAFNYSVDPLLYRWPRASWAPQAAFLPFDREVHYNLVSHARARSILLGNSQTQHGFRPSQWHVPGPVINAAIVGADLPEIDRALRRAQKVHRVDRAILGLDFTMSRGRMGIPPHTEEGFVIAPNGTMRLANLPGLFSFTLARASAIALVNRYRRHLAFFAPTGEALAPLYQQSTAAYGGTLGAMVYRVAQYEQNVRVPPNAFADQLRRVRDHACAGGTRLIVYLTPLHMVFIEALDDVGRAGAWEVWKRTVVGIGSERAGCGFDVWDFNTINPITTEPVPQAGIADGLAASWDGVHFKPWVGDRILARLQAGASDPDGFGVHLTPQTIDAALARDRHAGARYRQAHPDAPTPTDLVRMRTTAFF